MKPFRLLPLTGWKLTPKLLAAFLLTAVVPALAASLFSLNYFYGVSFEGAQRNLATELGTVRHYVADWGDRLEADTRLAARDNLVVLNLSLGLTEPVLDYLDSLQIGRHFALAYLLDARGRRVGRSAAGRRDSSEVTEDRLAAARQAGTLFSMKQDGRILLVSLVPVTDDSGRVQYFLMTGLDPGSGERGGILDSIQQTVSGPVVLTDADGLLGQAPGSPPWASARWPKQLPAPDALVPITSQGQTYLFRFTAVGDADAQAWVGVSFSLNQFQQVTTAAAWGLVFISALGVLLSCLAAIAFSRGLTRPLLAMARQAGAWTEGQGGKRLEVTTDDETGLLGRAFNEALDRLDVTLDSLRKTQNYLKNIFNSLTSVLVSVNEVGTVQEWNVAAERFNGLKAAEALGRKVWDLSPVFVGLGPLLDRAVATREPQFVKKDAGTGHERRSFDLCLYPLVWNGVSGAVIRMDDITVSLNKDRQLQQAQKIETVGTLTEGIAHNFNNLLTGIAGTVSLMRLELAGGVPDAAHLGHRLGMIETSTRKASEIVRRLMGLSRGSSGEFARVDLAAVVREVAQTGRMVLDRSVEVEVTAPETAPLYGDRSQLEQCLLNLLINASHAMTLMRSEGEHSGGTVRVTLAAVTSVKDFLTSHPEAVKSDYWVLQVRDSGVGINPENLSKIFDPFFTTKESDKGSGLGLAMVYSSIRQHNGFIDVYSEVGRGTTFSLYLPVLVPSSGDAPGPSTQSPEGAQRGQGLILVVDDEAVVRETAQLILEACGYQVVTAGNGEEGLAVYRERGSDICAVLLDSSMPRLSGPETLDALRILNPNVRVVMSSGLFSGEGSGRGPQDSRLRYLAKPYSLVELSEAFRTLLDGTF